MRTVNEILDPALKVLNAARERKVSKKRFLKSVFLAKIFVISIASVVVSVLPVLIHLAFLFLGPVGFWQKLFFSGIIGLAGIAEIIILILTYFATKAGLKFVAKLKVKTEERRGTFL